MADTVKEKVVSILTPIFGDGVRKLIDDYYDEKNPGELISLAHRMLTDYMGEENADKMLSGMIKHGRERKGVVQDE